MYGHGSMSAELEEKQRMRLNRVLAAIDDGNFWSMVKAELARDYESLFDNFLSFEEHVDSDYRSHSGD